MNIFLWVVQGLLALAFLAAGTFKLVTPRQQLVQKGMGWAVDFSDGSVKLIGLAEVLGAVGLVVPWATGIAPILTPVAAVGLTLVMGGAVMTHLRRKETPVPSVVLAPLALAVAVARFGIFG
jgi:uncharacterized membrane protein